MFRAIREKADCCTVPRSLVTEGLGAAAGPVLGPNERKPIMDTDAGAMGRLSYVMGRAIHAIDLSLDR